jgi:hypothetical protein
MVWPRVYSAGAYFDSGGMAHHGGILPASVERPLEKSAGGGTEFGEDRALRINHKDFVSFVVKKGLWQRHLKLS